MPPVQSASAIWEAEVPRKRRRHELWSRLRGRCGPIEEPTSPPVNQIVLHIGRL